MLTNGFPTIVRNKEGDHMKCLNCESMKIVSIEDGCGASAKCFKASKRGKTITWAMTGISPNNNWKREEGKDRVIASLNSKNAPYWCPIRKKKNIR